MTYANTFVPCYVENDHDYSPWVLTHKDDSQLNPEVVNEHWKEFIFLTGKDLDDDDLIDSFYGYLKERGYGTYYHSWPPIILDHIHGRVKREGMFRYRRCKVCGETESE
jgi:hypothetical protein